MENSKELYEKIFGRHSEDPVELRILKAQQKLESLKEIVMSRYPELQESILFLDGIDREFLRSCGIES